jgi:hypothetical protein
MYSISLDIFEFIEQHLQKLLLFLKQANIDNSNVIHKYIKLWAINNSFMFYRLIQLLLLNDVKKVPASLSLFTEFISKTKT